MSKIEWVVCPLFKPDLFVNVIRNRIYFCKELRDLCLEKDFRFIEFLKSDGLLGFRFWSFNDSNSLYLHLNNRDAMSCYSSFICNMIPKGKHQVFYDDSACVYYIKLS